MLRSALVGVLNKGPTAEDRSSHPWPYCMKLDSSASIWRGQAV